MLHQARSMVNKTYYYDILWINNNCSVRIFPTLNEEIMSKTKTQILTSIKKEDVNAMPLTFFEGHIHMIDSDELVSSAIEILKKEKVLGFDAESRPAFKKGESYPVSLLQLSTKTDAFLFRLNKISLSNDLIEILTDSNIKKVGVAIRDDIKGLQKIKRFQDHGFIEIAEMAVMLKIKNLGLRNLAAICFTQRISKGAKLSNWEAPILKAPQQSYAATDAWIGLKIYHYLLNALEGQKHDF